MQMPVKVACDACHYFSDLSLSLQLSASLEFWWNKKLGLLDWGSTELLKYE